MWASTVRSEHPIRMAIILLLGDPPPQRWRRTDDSAGVRLWFAVIITRPACSGSTYVEPLYSLARARERVHG